MLRTLVNVDPTNEYRSIEELFDRFFGQPTRPVPASTTLPIDIVEREGNLLIKAAVPGIDPKELEITVEKNVLSIRGETKSDLNTETDKVYRREVSYGSFSRSIRLPENLDLNAVSADFQNGLVTVTIPRIPEPEPQVIRVQVSGSETRTNSESQEEVKN